MAKRYERLSDDLIQFIQQQKLFFVGTAANDGTINVSPKGFDSLQVIDPGRVVWMNITGSGNETAAHLLQNERMTLMFCGFEERPKILRLYGKARAVHPRDGDWAQLSQLFEPHPGVRQYVDFRLEMAQTSCGFGVPVYDFRETRDNMDRWIASRGGREGVEQYWRENNQVSLDGLPTNIMEDS